MKSKCCFPVKFLWFVLENAVTDPAVLVSFSCEVVHHKMFSSSFSA